MLFEIKKQGETTPLIQISNEDLQDFQKTNKSLDRRSPNEALKGMQVIDIAQKQAEAREIRRFENKMGCCL